MSEDSKILKTRIQQLYCTVGDDIYNKLNTEGTYLKEGEQCFVKTSSGFYMTCGTGSTPIAALPRWDAQITTCALPSNSETTYNGEEQTYTARPDILEYAEVSGTTSATDAATYSIVYALKYPATFWRDGSSENKTVTWTIKPKEVKVKFNSIGKLASNISSASVYNPTVSGLIEKDNVKVSIECEDEDVDLGEYSDFTQTYPLTRSTPYINKCSNFISENNVDDIVKDVYAKISLTGERAKNYSLTTTTDKCAILHPTFNDCSVALIEKLVLEKRNIFSAGQKKVFTSLSDVEFLGGHSIQDNQSVFDQRTTFVKQNDYICLTVDEHTEDSLKLFFNKCIDQKGQHLEAFTGANYTYGAFDYSFASSYVQHCYVPHREEVPTTTPSEPNIRIKQNDDNLGYMAYLDDFICQLEKGFGYISETGYVNQENAINKAIGLGTDLDTIFRVSDKPNGILYAKNLKTGGEETRKYLLDGIYAHQPHDDINEYDWKVIFKQAIVDETGESHKIDFYECNSHIIYDDHNNTAIYTFGEHAQTFDEQAQMFAATYLMPKLTKDSSDSDLPIDAMQLVIELKNKKAD